MADKKISELNSILGSLTADDDLLVIVDSSTNETKKITKAELASTINAALIDGAPAALDTLNELAAALADDANFASTVTNSIATKVSKSGDTMTGNLDVQGTVTADGLTVDGDVVIDDAVPILRLDSPAVTWAGGEDLGGVDWYTKDTSGAGPTVVAQIHTESVGTSSLPIPEFVFKSGSAASMQDVLRVGYNGDISFYEDTGTTPKFFWDASAERLGIGTSSPATALDITGVSGIRLNNGEQLSITSGANPSDNARLAASSSSGIEFAVNGSSGVQALIDSSGKVGIGTSSPDANLEISDGSAAILRLTDSGSSAYSQLRADAGTLQLDANAGDAAVTEYISMRIAGSEAMRIDSSGNVGIGTSSPATALDVTGTVTADGLTVANTAVFAGDFDGGTAATYIRLQDDTDNFVFGTNNGLGNFLIKNETADALRLTVANNGDISFYEDTGTTPKFFWDASAEKLGIGTSVPLGELSIYNASSNPSLSIRGPDAGASNLWFGDTADWTRGGIAYNNASEYMSFFTNNLTERMRIDSSGNLLVGQSSTTTPGTGNTTVGVSIRGGDGTIHASRDGNRALYVNRNNDGPIISVLKSGVEVGSIGTGSTSNFQIYNAQTSHVGLEFGSPNIMPTNNGGTLTDSGAALGSSSYRFSDLYLSGGVYLGGTGAANHLDDYETGTFTPTIVTTGTNNVTYSRQDGGYVKVGDLVHVEVSLIFSGNSSTGTLYFGGFPFTAKAYGGNGNDRGAGSVGYWTGFNGLEGPLFLIDANSTQGILRRYDGTDGSSAFTANNLAYSSNMHFSLTYKTT